MAGKALSEVEASATAPSGSTTAWMLRPGRMRSPARVAVHAPADDASSRLVGTPAPGAVIRTESKGTPFSSIRTRTAGAAVLASFATGNTRTVASRPATRGTEPSGRWTAWTR